MASQIRFIKVRVRSERPGSWSLTEAKAAQPTFNSPIRPVKADLYSAFTGLIGLLNVGWAAFSSVSDQLPGLSERTLTLINLIWLAIASFQITRLAAGYTAAGQ